MAGFKKNEEENAREKFQNIVLIFRFFFNAWAKVTSRLKTLHKKNAADDWLSETLRSARCMSGAAAAAAAAALPNDREVSLVRSLWWKIIVWPHPFCPPPLSLR